MVNDAALDLGYRMSPSGSSEFFLLDAMGDEVATFGYTGGAIISPNAEQAALAYCRDRRCQVNFLPSWHWWNGYLSSAICAAFEL